MENLDIYFKNRNEYDELLRIIIKDIERIKISLSDLDDDTKQSIKMKLNLLKNSLINQTEKVFSSYENNHIVIDDEYVAIQYLNKEKVIEINQSMDVAIGTEYIALIKRNMKNFYFCNRKVIYEIEEGNFVIRKIKSKWNNEHYEIKNKSILYEKTDIGLDEFKNVKTYMKGCKK